MATGTYEGVVTGIPHRDTYQEMMTAEARMLSEGIQFAAYNKSPFTKVLGVEAWGVDAIKNPKAFGLRGEPRRMLQFTDGGTIKTFDVFATTGTSAHKGRLGNFNPSMTEGGSEGSFSWFRLYRGEFIPDVDVQDNAGTARIHDIKAHKMDVMKQDVVRDFALGILGSSSAPDYGVQGPSALYCDLPNLVSVTQTRTVMNIATTNSFWANQYKAIASIGGGGEMDRPITLRRSLIDLQLDTVQLAESPPTTDYLQLATKGAWQYLDRLIYADVVQGGAVMATKESYDAAGIQNKVFNGAATIWDPAVTVPTGATASTEAIYGLPMNHFFVDIKRAENFLVKDWEEPRNHDLNRTLVAMILCRYCPGLRNRRTFYVAYNMPACGD